MKMLFKQKLFAFLDTYNIYDEYDNILYKVEAEFDIRHHLVVYDANGNEVGRVLRKMFSIIPAFEIYVGGQSVGEIQKKIRIFEREYSIDYYGWKAIGDFIELEYEIVDASDNIVAQISKEIFHLTDTYIIDVKDSANALPVLLFVLAIDAEKCSRK